MRLAVVSPFIDRRHGTERALAELLERLACTYGCEIHLYAQRVEDLAIDRPVGLDLQTSGAIFWHRVPSVPGPQIVQFPSWLILNSLCRKLDRLLRGLPFDLILSPGVNCLDANIVLVHAVFQRFQQFWNQERDNSTSHSGFLRRLHRRVYYAMITRLERRIYVDPRVAIAAVSKRTAGHLAEYALRRNVLVIPNGVDTGLFSPAARLARRAEIRSRWSFRDDDFVLLLIGNAWHAKGLTTVLEAMAALPHLPLHLIVAGSDVIDPFRKTAERLGILDRCHWLAPCADVLGFYAAADVYVSPSREDPFGLPVAEAMACGLPVITSLSAGVSELMHDKVDGFVLSEPRDSRALAEVLRKLQASADLRTQIGETAAATAREWTWDRNAAAVWQLLQDAIKRKSGASTPQINP